MMFHHHAILVLLGVVCHHTAAEEGHEHDDSAHGGLWEWAGLFDLHDGETYGESELIAAFVIVLLAHTLCLVNLCSDGLPQEERKIWGVRQ